MLKPSTLEPRNNSTQLVTYRKVSFSAPVCVGTYQAYLALTRQHGQSMFLLWAHCNPCFVPMILVLEA